MATLNLHRTVLLHESVEGLSLRTDSVVVDATLGGAGHAEEICKQLGKDGVFVGIDADAHAIEIAKERLNETLPNKILVRDTFAHLVEILRKEKIEGVDAVLFDLGWSQNQLELSGRGFSFLRDEPLLMTLASEGDGLTAYEIVNGWSEEQIADVIYDYGEERAARRIAKAIVRARSEGPIETTFGLVAVIESVLPRYGRTNPATRTFQALRIATNKELEVLGDGLAGAWSALKAPGARLAVISFHSLEDRIVKHFMKEKVLEGTGKLGTKKPITATEEELVDNPRARSAKLRILMRL